MAKKQVLAIPAVRARTLYRVDYFRTVISGKTWIGKEFFHAESLDDAKRQARIRGTRLGLWTDVHIAFE